MWLPRAFRQCLSCGWAPCVCAQAAPVQVCVRQPDSERCHGPSELARVALKPQRSPLHYDAVPALGAVLGPCSMRAPHAETHLSSHAVVPSQELDVKVEFRSSQGSSVKVSHRVVIFPIIFFPSPYPSIAHLPMLPVQPWLCRRRRTRAELP